MRKKLFMAALLCVGICGCNGTKDCPGADTTFMNVASYKPGTVFSFVNSSGTEMKFSVADENASSAYSTKCESWGMGPDCSRTQCVATATYMALSDSERGGSNDISVNLKFQSQGYITNTLTMRIFDYTFFAYFDSSHLSFVHPDTLYQHVSLGIHNYDSVYVFSVDTSTTSPKGIWRIYLSTKAGLLAFSDRQSHSTFFLK